MGGDHCAPGERSSAVARSFPRPARRCRSHFDILQLFTRCISAGGSASAAVFFRLGVCGKVTPTASVT